MIRQPHTCSREIIVANAIQQVVGELRLVEISDYIAFIRLEQFAAVADLVDAAAERYLMPGTLRLGHGGEAHVGWTGEPRILLDLELHPRGVKVYFQLGLTAEHASVEVSYIAFDKPSQDADANTAFLERSLQESRLRGRPAASSATAAIQP